MVLLTGASGYVGRAVLRDLTAHGVRVRCLVLGHDAAAPPPGPLVEIVRGDVTRAEDLAAVGEGVGTVIHSAAMMPPATSESIRRVNVDGTRVMLDWARRWGVERFVYLSAVSATYGAPTAYGESKRQAEALVRGSGVPHTILRPTMVYGPGGGAHFQKLVALIRRAPALFPVIGPGTQRLQPVDIDDVVAAVRLAREHRGALGRTYGVSGATVVTFDELVDHIAEALGRRLILVHLPLAACRAAGGAMERIRPQSFLGRDAITGISQDASLDWSDFGRECGYSPAPLRVKLERAVAA